MSAPEELMPWAFQTRTINGFFFWKLGDTALWKTLKRDIWLLALISGPGRVLTG